MRVNLKTLGANLRPLGANLRPLGANLRPRGLTKTPGAKLKPLAYFTPQHVGMYLYTSMGK
jgi:hypothetical protein